MKNESHIVFDHASVVLDNAFLFSAANSTIGNRKIRNVQLLGLSGLADALVMHQRITVDRQGWEYFANAVPPTWLPSIQPLVDIIDFDLPTEEIVVDAVASSANSILLGYALTVVDQVTATDEKRYMNENYFSYTGSDLGKNIDEQKLIRLLQDRLDRAIPPMHLHLRHAEHVSALQCLVRAVQYQFFASELGQAYVPHDYRGRILNILARDRTQPKFRELWERLMGRVSASIRKEYDETLDWTRPAEDGSFALWERLEMPTFLAMALERTQDIGDLFHHVMEIRTKAMPLRHLLENFTDVENDQERAFLAQEIRRVAHELDSISPTKPGSIVSITAGLPASVGLRVNLPPSSERRSVAFVRDIYDNHAVPLSLSEDVERVFGKPIQQLALDPLLDITPSENVLDTFFERAGSGVPKAQDL